MFTAFSPALFTARAFLLFGKQSRSHIFAVALPGYCDAKEFYRIKTLIQLTPALKFREGKVKTRSFACILAIVLLTVSLALALATISETATAAALAPGDQQAPLSGAPPDTLVVAQSAEAIVLDPAMAYDTASGGILEQVYDTLVTYNRERSDLLIPQLASAWTVSPDGKTYTFTLRRGVRFHAGGSLDAHDVAYTFQRGLLQSDPGGPQWLLIQPIMGYNSGDITEEIAGGAYAGDAAGLRAHASPQELLATCNKVKAAIVADDTAETVTFHLANPWDAFLVTLAGEWSSVLDQEWTAAQGDWNGDCATWQDYYSPSAPGSKLRYVANGTGPYVLDHWTHGSEVLLLRNTSYWRRQPMWPGGPSGTAAIPRVLMKQVGNESDRLQMLRDGQADLAYVSPDSGSSLADRVMFRYEGNDGHHGKLDQITGTLAAFTNLPGVSASDAFFNFDVSTAEPNPYLGSGALDGSGIPANFFSDIHVRRGFNYAFDWDQYIAQAFAGNGIQRRGPIIKGLIGYSENYPIFSHDPALAVQEFNQAWGGQVAAKGFRVTIAYNTGNLVRQKVAEILKTNIEALDPKYHVDIAGISWPDLLRDIRAKRVPIAVSGWMQDIAHPSNWVQPYLLGTYASRQNLPVSMTAVYRQKFDACMALLGEAARPCWEDLQRTAYEDAIDIFLAQGSGTNLTSARVQGYYVNSGQPDTYYYALSKSSLPVARTLVPAGGNTLSFSSHTGASGVLLAPAGTVSETTHLVVTPDLYVAPAPVLGRLTFGVAAYHGDGTDMDALAFAKPVALTLNYNASAIWHLLEGSLHLLRWNGSAWEEGACSDYQRNDLTDTLELAICETGTYALAGDSLPLFMPLLVRS